MSNSEPIDFIDLTQDSPANKVLRLRSRNVENVDVTDTQRVRRHNRKQRDLRENFELATSLEVIDLETTNVPEASGTESRKRPVETDGIVALTCPICLDRLSSVKKPTSTKCGHVFCGDCLKLAVQKFKKCPTCQTPVKLVSCTRLYI